MQYNQFWHIFILSDYHIHAVHKSISCIYTHFYRISIANVHFLPESSAPIATQVQLWCSRPQRSPREIELTVHCGSVASHCPVFWKNVQTIAQSGTLCQSDVTQVSWFLIQNNSALYTQIWLKPSARVVQQPASPWATHNGVGLQAREEWGENNHPVFQNFTQGPIIHYW